MGEALRGRAQVGGGGRRSLAPGTRAGRFAWLARRLRARCLALIAIPGLLLLLPLSPRDRLGAQPVAPDSLTRGRFTFVFYPSEAPLARGLLEQALKQDSFPGLPLPRARARIALAPDHETFRRWVGPAAPEWGSAIAFPTEQVIVLQGRSAGSDAGDPRATLRHELAHLALYEYLGDLPTRWFDEGYASYAARELDRDNVLATNVALALRGIPTLDQLEQSFGDGSMAAQSAYALSYRAVVELAELDPGQGLARLFSNWKSAGRLDGAIRASYGITLADFEERWRSKTRRRYGVLAFVSDFTVAGVLMLLVVLPLYLARRRRYRARMRDLLAADAASERASGAGEGALAELLDERPAAIGNGDERARAHDDSSSPPRSSDG